MIDIAPLGKYIFYFKGSFDDDHAKALFADRTACPVKNNAQ